VLDRSGRAVLPIVASRNRRSSAPPSTEGSEKVSEPV